jgi:hypothetical protein
LNPPCLFSLNPTDFLGSISILVVKCHITILVGN